MRAVVIRVGQVGHSLAARLAPPDAALAAQTLTLAERRLFDSMAPADRAHALRVAARLARAGQRHPALLKAALLHDVGKAGQGVRLAHRVARVLLGVAAPRALARLAARPVGWRRPFHALVHHAEGGAQLAAEAGSDALTVALIRHHAARAVPPALAPHADLLRALQAADDAG